MYRLISLDTSTTDTGYCIFLNGHIEKSGHITSEGEDRLDDMIMKIYALLSDTKYLGTIVIEKMSFVRNGNTDRTLAELIGAVRGYALMKKKEYIEYNVNRWRSLIAKNIGEPSPKKREEAKAWSKEKAADLNIYTDNDNESDAILIGIARFIELLGTDFTSFAV